MRVAVTAGADSRLEKAVLTPDSLARASPMRLRLSKRGMTLPRITYCWLIAAIGGLLFFDTPPSSVSFGKCRTQRLTALAVRSVIFCWNMTSVWPLSHAARMGNGKVYVDCSVWALSCVLSHEES